MFLLCFAFVYPFLTHNIGSCFGNVVKVLPRLRPSIERSGEDTKAVRTQAFLSTLVTLGRILRVRARVSDYSLKSRMLATV